MQRNINTPNVQWLAFLRMSLGVFCLLHFCSIQPDFADLFSFNGYIQPDIMNATHDSFSPSVFTIYTFIQKQGYNFSYESILLFFRMLYFIVLVFFTLGLFTRMTAIVTLLCQLILIKSIHYFQYGTDFFTTILLFYSVVFPVGHVFSLDNLIFKRTAITATKVNYLRLLQIHICIAYCVSGIDKLMGLPWQNGEAMWKAVTSHNNLGLINPAKFAAPALFIIGGWLTVIIEMCYPVFVNIRKTRKLWIYLTIGLHLSIILFLGLFFFSTIMILFNLTAYYIPYLKEKEVPDTANASVFRMMKLPLFRQLKLQKNS